MSDEGSDDTIISLCKKSFMSRTYPEKLELIRIGRPMPPLKRLKKENKGFVRNFNTEQYEKTKWLCGSEGLNKLFCWPCLLFSKEKTVWNSVKRGYSDLNNLHTAIGRHEKSEAHITSWIAYKCFGRSRADLKQEEHRSRIVSKHNEQVKKNRAILRRLIAITCYLGRQDVEFERIDGDVSNRGNYIELVHLLADYDKKLSDHLEQSTAFTGLTHTIQADIIQAIYNVMMSEIKKEIKRAKFVSVLLDEISDVSNSSQVSTVFRYVQNDAVVERFVGFSDTSSDRSALAVSQLVSKRLEEFQCMDKLIAQTYDGAVVMSDQLSLLQEKVKKTIPEATFAHCYAHKLNLILAQAVCQTVRECRVFFATLNGFGSFFSHSSKRSHLFESFLLKRFQKICFPRWAYSSDVIQTVWEQKASLIELFEEITNQPGDWDNETIKEAQGFLSVLPELEFNFLLTVFQSIFSETEIFYHLIQESGMNNTVCFSEAKVLEQSLHQKRGDFEKIWLSVGGEVESSKKRARGNDLPPKDHFKAIYMKLLDIIISQIKVRFSSQNALLFVELLHCNQFKKHCHVFPEDNLMQLKKAYGKYFDLSRLRAELSVMYSSPVFESKNISDLQRILQDNGLHYGLPEIFKLSTLILTIPANISSVEYSLPALEKIKLHRKNNKGKVISSGLALMAIERDLLQEVKSKSNFYDDVIEEFRKKGHQIELTFK